MVIKIEAIFRNFSFISKWGLLAFGSIQSTETMRQKTWSVDERAQKKFSSYLWYTIYSEFALPLQDLMDTLYIETLSNYVPFKH